MKGWQSIVKSIAPILGTALGGPMAGAAINTLSNALLGMKSLDVDVFNLEQAGRLNARVTHKDHFMPAFLCLLLTLMVSIDAYMLMTTEIPEDNANIVHMVFGQVLTAWTGSVAYWIGTTKGSSDKSKLMAKS